MKYVAIIAVLAVIIGGGWYLMQSPGATPVENSGTETSLPTAADVVPTNDPGITVTTVDTVQEVVVRGNNFTFDTKEIRVKEGTTVRVVFENSGGSHDWVLDEFDARTKMLKSGESETIEFVASKKGSFEYYCSVGEHRAMGMVGKLIVE